MQTDADAGKRGENAFFPRFRSISSSYNAIMKITHFVRACHFKLQATSRQHA